MKKLVQSQRKFYEDQFRTYGNCPQALSWKDEETQSLRFREIASGIPEGASIHEVGCGLGHLGHWLKKERLDNPYSGSDIVEPFVQSCQKELGPHFWLHNILDETVPAEMQGKDFYVLSGSFYTMGSNRSEDWNVFIEKTLFQMFSLAGRGIAFNILSRYADRYDPGLYYAWPEDILKLCAQKLSRFVSIRQATPLYEFTVHVYKSSDVCTRFGELAKHYVR